MLQIITMTSVNRTYLVIPHIIASFFKIYVELENEKILIELWDSNFQIKSYQGNYNYNR